MGVLYRGAIPAWPFPWFVSRFSLDSLLFFCKPSRSVPMNVPFSVCTF